MSARKLGGFAGLVFVFAVVFGGVAIGAGTPENSNISGAAVMDTTNVEWD